MEFEEIIEALQDQLGERHIMLSYQWDIQDTVKDVCEEMKSHGVNVWMDIDGGMSGNINEAMAEGVEGAGVVCPFMTERYQASKNCSLELNYANDCQKTIVPCMAQARTDDGNCFRAKGWLGIITAGKLWIDFKGNDNMGARVKQLIRECANRLYTSEKPVGKMMNMNKKKQKRAPPKRKIKTIAESQKQAAISLLPGVGKMNYPLNQGLKDGDIIEVWGEYHKFRTAINITTNPENYLLHFNFRAEQHCIVMNSKLNGIWDTEIRDYATIGKFNSGEFAPSFHLKIYCSEYEFTFEMNGVKLQTSFPIRNIPLQAAKELILQGQEGTLVWTMLKIPEKEASEQSHIPTNSKEWLNVEKDNPNVILEKSLEYGDEVEVWGKFANHRCNFNIMRGDKDYLLHFDIRSASDSVCIDGCINEAWPGSINMHRNDFYGLIANSDKGEFNLKVTFAESGMKLAINGNDLGVSIPYTFDLSTATHIFLCEEKGSVQQWKSIKLPKAVQLLQTFSPYQIENMLVGNVINVTAKYLKNHPPYAINICADDNNFILHVAVRPTCAQIAMNTLTNGGWGAEVSVPAPPALQESEVFDIFITAGDNSFVIEFSKDGEEDKILLKTEFPYRMDPSRARFVKLTDDTKGSGVIWTELYLPDGTSFLRE